MKRKFKDNKYGVDGEFYVEGKGFAGQEDDSSVVDHNRPPKTQPSLWLQWEPTKDGKYLEWNEAEKFYNYIEWLKYLVKNILTPRGYTLEGVVHWGGEDREDIGTLQCCSERGDTKVLTKAGVHTKELRPNSTRFIKELANEKGNKSKRTKKR